MTVTTLTVKEGKFLKISSLISYLQEQKNNVSKRERKFINDLIEKLITLYND